MQTIRNFNIWQALCPVVVILSMISCKKETPPKYSGEDFLYFRGTNNINPNTTNIHAVYQAERSFSFLLSAYQQDTIQTNNSSINNLPLAIRTDGRLSDMGRPVLMELEGDGKEYVVLPHPDSIYIRANTTEYVLNMKIIRPPLSDTGTKTITLILKNNDPFKPENHTWNKCTYKFGNLFLQPIYYYEKETVFGEFSAAKMQTMQEAVNLKGAAYWQSNPNVITLLNFINLQGGKTLSFDPFSYNDLYNLIDNVQLLLWYDTSGPVRTAYNNINAEIASLSKALLIEKRKAGNPVLDQSGNEISFP